MPPSTNDSYNQAARKGGTSSRRYRAYLDRRRSRIKEDKGHLKSDERPNEKTRSFRELAGGFWKLLEGQHGTIYFALTTLTISVIAAFPISFGLKIAIDYIILETPGPEALAKFLPFELPRTEAGEPNRSMLLIYTGIGMIALTLLSTFFSMLGRWQATKLTKLMMVELRRRVFRHSMTLPLNRIQEIKSGGVASNLREDAGGVAELIFHLIYNPFRAVLFVLGGLLFIGYNDLMLLVGAVLFLPLIWLTHKTWIGLVRPIYRDVRRTRETIDGNAAETFGGMRVVRGFARSTGETKRFVAGNGYMVRQEILAWWWSRSVDVAWSLLIPLATTAMVVYGGNRIIDGSLSVGDLVFFVTIIGLLLGPLETLATSATNAQNSLAALDRTLDLLDEEPEFAEAEQEREGETKTILDRATARGEIEIRSLGFSYPRPTKRGKASDDTADEQAPVLIDINLQVAPGETIALVGASGSGKTTLCNLIARFYDPTHGAVLFDGHDLRDVDVSSFRRLLGIVEQDVFLFDGTIAQNIAYARKDAPQRDIIQAATLAAAHDFITDTDHGYDTMIGERGVRLSGGQKQRLAIARAILADPRVLILDEATSNLDAESEALIQRSLRTLMEGRTTFVIAHRLSTIRHADRIVVLERGKLVEQGSHDELLAQAGRYATLLRMQLDPNEAEQLG